MNPTSLLVNVSLSIINWVKDSMKRCHVKQTLDYLIALLGLIVNFGRATSPTKEQYYNFD